MPLTRAPGGGGGGQRREGPGGARRPRQRRAPWPLRAMLSPPAQSAPHCPARLQKRTRPDIRRNIEWLQVVRNKVDATYEEIGLRIQQLKDEIAQFSGDADALKDLRPLIADTKVSPRACVRMAVHRRRRGGYPPPPQTKVTTVGKNEFYNWENLTDFWVPDPPSPPSNLCRPKFQPPQSEGAGRGLVPPGDQETGEQNFCCPHPPPPTEMGPDRKQAQHPPPPQHALAPSLQAHGDRGPSGSGRRATSMLGSGTHMVTQQVVLLSHTSEQVDPSTTLPPPPPSLRPRREGCTESAPSGPKKWRL